MSYETLKKVLTPIMAYRSMRSLMRFIEACKYLDRRVWDLEGGNRLIYQALTSGKPQAIGRFGSTELQAIRSYLRYRQLPDWEQKTAIYRETLYSHSGVFPNTPEIYQRFCESMLADVLPEATVMAVWFNAGEANIIKKYCLAPSIIPLGSLETYYCRCSDLWTQFLEGKRVLVIHPFVNSIRLQYSKRMEIWNGRKDILPAFDLIQIRAPHYPVLVPPKFPHWFASLEDLQNQMSELDFDVALIGAGAYSFPLAVYAQKLGKHGIHLGGALQIYFGIKGKRWDQHPVISKFYNEHWIRPLPEDTPQGTQLIEGGCYW